jgi:hypothetical protein
MIPCLASGTTNVTVRIIFTQGEINAMLFVLSYPTSPSLIRSVNTTGILSSSNEQQVIVEFSNFPAISNLSDVVVLVDGLSTVSILPQNIRSSFSSTQVSFLAPSVTINDTLALHKVFVAYIYELQSLCNRSCPGVVALNYTNSLAAQVQFQSRSSCTVMQRCHIDLYVTNLLEHNLSSIQISSKSSLQLTIQESGDLMGAGLNTMSVIKISALSSTACTSELTVHATLQKIKFSVTFHDASDPYFTKVYPTMVPTYGGSIITIYVDNIFRQTPSVCRVIWTAQIFSTCDVERNESNGSFAFSVLVPVLSGDPAIYNLALEIPNYGVIKSGSVLSFAPDTTISISPSSAFSDGGKFVVVFQNFPLSTSISSIIPVVTESNAFLNVDSIETFSQGQLLSGQFILTYTNLNSGNQLMTVSHASIATCSSSASILILDPTKPRIVKISPLTGDFKASLLIEMQVHGALPTNQINAIAFLLGKTGRNYISAWSVMSVVESDSFHIVTIHSSELPEPGKCMIQLRLSSGEILNSSNITFFDPKSLKFQSVCNLI